jgi:tRNA A37 N6-isopentenylltransferase MiaA
VSALAERQDRRETIAEIVRETRRYAKRQETWFRKERGNTWLDSTERDDMSLVLEHLAGALVDRASRE